MSSPSADPGTPSKYARDALRVEGITTCIDFDEILDENLTKCHSQFDHVIVVTNHADRATAKVCFKHGVTCVKTDLFNLHDRPFNKGAAINAGFHYFRYFGWRNHFDVDTLVPNNFHRILFSPMTHLDRRCLYGADRVDVTSKAELNKVYNHRQHSNQLICSVPGTGKVRERIVYPIDGYIPIGFFQLWHASEQREYPHSLGSAAHDDSMFAMTWPRQFRHLLPQVFCLHLHPPGVPGTGKFVNGAWVGQNWNGRQSKRFT